MLWYSSKMPLKSLMCLEAGLFKGDWIMGLYSLVDRSTEELIAECTIASRAWTEGAATGGVTWKAPFFPLCFLFSMTRAAFSSTQGLCPRLSCVGVSRPCTEPTSTVTMKQKLLLF